MVPTWQHVYGNAYVGPCANTQKSNKNASINNNTSSTQTLTSSKIQNINTQQTHKKEKAKKQHTTIQNINHRYQVQHLSNFCKLLALQGVLKELEGVWMQGPPIPAFTFLLRSHAKKHVCKCGLVASAGTWLLPGGCCLLCALVPETDTERHNTKRSRHTQKYTHMLRSGSTD